MNYVDKMGYSFGYRFQVRDFFASFRDRPAVLRFMLLGVLFLAGGIVASGGAFLAPIPPVPVHKVLLVLGFFLMAVGASFVWLRHPLLLEQALEFEPSRCSRKEDVNPCGVASVATPTEAIKGRDAFGPDESLLRKVLDEIPMAVWLVDDAARSVLANAAAKCLHESGLNLGVRDWHSCLDWSHGAPCGIHHYESPLARVLRTGEAVVGERLTARDRDGTPRALLASAIPLMSAREGERRVMVIGEDVTDRQRAAEELRVSKELFRTTFDSAAIGVMLCDPAARFLMINGALCGTIGYTEDELMKMYLHDISHPEDVETCRAAIKRMTAGEISTHELEVRCIRKDGRMVWLLVSIALVRDQDDNPLYLVGQALDITVRKQADENLRARQASLANAQRIGCLGDWQWDCRSGKHYWSEQTRRILGHTEDEANGMTEFLLLIHPDDRSAVQQASERALSGQLPFNIDYRIVFPDGTVRTVHSQAEVIFGPRGEPLRMVGVVQDITDRKRTEQELIESRQQLRELAAYRDAVREEERKRIAGEIHDELGQLLTALKMDISLLQRRVPDEEFVVRKVRDMRDLVEKTIGMVRRVATHLRPAALNLGIVPALEWLVEDFNHHTGLSPELVVSNPDIQLDEPTSTAVFRIVQECLTNVARHANASQVDVALVKTEEAIELTIRDNGRGFDPEQTARRPSFGLLGMRERVLLQGGSLSIESAPGMGCRLSIWMPIAGEACSES